MTKRGWEMSGMAMEGRAALQAGRALALLAVPGDLLCPEQGEDRWGREVPMQGLQDDGRHPDIPERSWAL